MAAVNGHAIAGGLITALDCDAGGHVFPGRGVWFAGPEKGSLPRGSAGGRYPQLAVESTQFDAHGRLGEDRRARSFYAAVRRSGILRCETGRSTGASLRRASAEPAPFGGPSQPPQAPEIEQVSGASSF